VTRDGSRFTMLETVREYAAELLAASPDAPAVARRHTVWCVAFTRAAEQGLEGPEQALWYDRLDAEQENLRAAAAWGVANGEPETALEIYGALWRFWVARGTDAEARGVLRAAVAAHRGEPALRAKALNAAGVLAGAAGDFPAARESREAALERAGELGDRWQMARALGNLGVVAMSVHDHVSALVRYGEAADIWK
jgi:hypothetical protein